MQPPFYDQRADERGETRGNRSVMGMKSRMFDDHGSKFDLNGNLKDGGARTI